MKEGSLTVASIAGAIVASMCCIGPLVVAVLGLGTFAAATVFQQLRPYLLGLTGLLLAAAWYFTYRIPRKESREAEVCPPKAAARYGKPLLWVATGLVVLLVGFPYYSSLVWKALAQAPSPSVQTVRVDSSLTLNLNVKGMTCAGCAAAVQSSLAGLKGVLEASVSLEGTSATVKYQPTRVTVQDMLGAVEKAGFTATVKQ